VPGKPGGPGVVTHGGSYTLRVPASPAVDVVDVPAASRFEGSVDGAMVGFVAYRRDAASGALRLMHAEVSADLQGRGIGSALVRGVLEELAARGERIVPVCSFVRSFVRDNPRVPVARRVSRSAR
jgi:predicted GNAT family acetyltransferase